MLIVAFVVLLFVALMVTTEFIQGCVMRNWDNIVDFGTMGIVVWAGVIYIGVMLFASA